LQGPLKKAYKHKQPYRDAIGDLIAKLHQKKASACKDFHKNPKEFDTLLSTARSAAAKLVSDHESELLEPIVTKARNEFIDSVCKSNSVTLKQIETARDLLVKECGTFHIVTTTQSRIKEINARKSFETNAKAIKDQEIKFLNHSEDVLKQQQQSHSATATELQKGDIVKLTGLSGKQYKMKGGSRFEVEAKCYNSKQGTIYNVVHGGAPRYTVAVEEGCKPFTLTYLKPDNLIFVSRPSARSDMEGYFDKRIEACDKNREWITSAEIFQKFENAGKLKQKYEDILDKLIADLITKKKSACRELEKFKIEISSKFGPCEGVSE